MGSPPPASMTDACRPRRSICRALIAPSPPRRRSAVHRRHGNAGPEGELAAFAAQMALEAVLEEVPHAFARLFLRLGVAVGDIGRHEDAHAAGRVALAMLLEHALELLARARRLGAVAARGEE